MLCALLDGRARTSTELAAIAGIGAPTASLHLARLGDARLIRTVAQGKHRYHRLASAEVACALEALMVVAGEPRDRFVPRTPTALRHARSCYDHMAGAVAVAIHDALTRRRWLSPAGEGDGYDLTRDGAAALESLGVDLSAVRGRRRRFAYPCLDWSERRPHVGGALGAAILAAALARGWVAREPGSRALSVTRSGQREMFARFGAAEPRSAEA